MKAHEELLNKTLIVYKLLSNTLADIATGTPKIVVVCGEEDDGNVSCDCWKVNHPDEIVHMCDIPAEDLAGKFSICAIPQGFVITGYAAKPLCLMFIASTKLWVRLQDLLDNRHGHGSICVKEVLYVFGGFVGKPRKSMEESDSVHSMIIKDGECKNEPSMPLAVAFPKVTNICDSVYLLDETTNQLFHLDTTENIWKQLASLSGEEECCVGVSMTSAQGKLLVAGGSNRICAWYQPETNTWCTGQGPRYQHTYGALVLAHHNNKLLLLGGNYEGRTDAVEEYNIEENKWSVCSYKMPKKINGHHAIVLNMQG